MKSITRWLFIILISASVILSACNQATKPAESIKPSQIEEIAGSEFKRVILTEKAAERLGIETIQVREEVVNRTSHLSSEVVTIPEAVGSGSDDFWVRVPVTEGLQPMVDRRAPVRITSYDYDDEENNNDEDEMIGEPDDREGEDDDDALSALYYKVRNPGPNLSTGQRLLVEVPLVGNGETHKVVPYAAVIYGVHGETWVYTNPEPLVFVRTSIVIDVIQGDKVFLIEGPEIGTAVVTVGGAELFGTETGVSK